MNNNGDDINTYSYGTYSYGNGNYNQFPGQTPQNNGKKEGFTKGVILGVVLSLFAFFCIALANLFIDGGSESSGGTGGGGADVFTDEQAEKLQQIQTLIEQYSYYEQDKDVMMDNIYMSLLYSLDDKYAAYYNEETFKAMMESSTGEYYGIGCVVTQEADTGYVKVVQPYKNSPAYDAGMAVGDVILKADDMELTGKDLNEAVSYIKGKEGTAVSIKYLRDGRENTVEIVRKKIEVPTVEYDMLEDSIGYIQITGFESVTVKQFKEAVESMQKDGAKGLIFDVRSNPGGMYDSVVDMLDMLLPEGILVYTEDKYGNRETEYSDEECIDMPMAVLINGDSASASEIFAAAMQDYEAAEIIGTTSYGKGIVQSVIPLGDGTGLKFTVSSYFTPKGVCIHETGVTPDTEVELPEDENAYDEYGYIKDGYDTQLNAAVDYINGRVK